MSSEAILENPALFAGEDLVDQDEIIERYFEFLKVF